MASRRRSQKLLAAITVIASAAAAVVVVELALRLFRDEDRFYPYYPNSVRLSYPNDEITPGVTGVSRFTTNSYGVRGREPTGRETVRILTIGGSTTADTALDDTEAWAARIEQYLGQELGHPEDVWVANSGVDGQLSHHHLMQAIYFLPKLPSMNYVIVHAGVNDLGLWFHHKSFDANFLDDPQNWDARIAETFRLSNYTPPDWPLYKRTELWKTFSHLKDTYVTARNRNVVDGSQIQQDEALKWLRERQRIHKERGTEMVPQAKIDSLPTALESYGKVLARIAAEIRKNGAQPIFMTQIVQSKFETEEERARFWMGDINDGEGFVREEEFPVFLDKYNQEMRRVASANDILLIDLGAAVGNKGDLFYDGMHYNEYGASRVGKAAADFIFAQLKHGMSDKGPGPDRPVSDLDPSNHAPLGGLRAHTRDSAPPH